MPETQTPPIHGLASVLTHHRLSSLEPGSLGARPEKLVRRTQPIPFRRYPGARRITLPLDSENGTAAAPPASPRLAHLASLLESSLALSGWKRSANAGFGLRVVPSAGNLHPSECYLLTKELESRADEGSAAVYHYSPFDHALERRRKLPEPVWQSLRAASPEASIFFVLSTIYWRTAWKYGERAFRLCQLDAGHAAAALDAAAGVEGRAVRWIDAPCDALERLVGCGRNGETDGPSESQGAEAEEALCLLALVPRGNSVELDSWRPEEALLRASEATPLTGEASRISEHHRHWPGLESIREATRRGTDAEPMPWTSFAAQPPSAAWDRPTLLRRRSRSTFEDRPLDREAFEALIARGTQAGSCFPWRGKLASLLFVHRVEHLDSGLYAVVDGEVAVEALRSNLRPGLAWRAIRSTAKESTGPELFQLFPGDARRTIAHLAGDQSSAADSAFTVLFLADLASATRSAGAEAYRHLHWRAGERAHHLYLEAEARGLAGTALGGFFDERIRTVLGLEDDTWWPLYAMAIGHRGAVDGTLEPPYAHRQLDAEPRPASRGGWGSKPAR